jgi:ubiquinone biosynthesis monooxygenase Coq7
MANSVTHSWPLHDDDSRIAAGIKGSAAQISARLDNRSRHAMRHYTTLDLLLGHLDQAVRTVFGGPPTARRANPGAAHLEAALSAEQRTLAARLMRVNHAGEIAAQGLYQGQALTARLDAVRDSMEQAADEENDHLAWCAGRLHELDSHTSRLDPLWYLGAVSIGALAGIAGDKWSLGFVAETERQVVRHLDEHLQRLPAEDARSRAILDQMRRDEAGHATVAVEAGAAPLPEPIKRVMGLASKVMTETAYWI